MVLIQGNFSPFLSMRPFHFLFFHRFIKDELLNVIDILVSFKLLFLPFFQILECIFIEVFLDKCLIIIDLTLVIHASFKFCLQECLISVVVFNANLEFNFQLVN